MAPAAPQELSAYAIFAGVRAEIFFNVRAHEQPAGIPRKWTVADSAEVYGVKYWGNNYFSINDAGNVQAHPAGADGGSIDLKELVDEVARRGIGLPLLIRFSDVLKSRIVELNETFRRAIAEYGYKGEYKGVYPIKVNQHRYVVEEIVQFGRPYHYGLEAGSKPELLAVMAMLDDEEALIVCNGYKDEEYIETALMASKLGRTVLIVVEKFSELALIAEIAKKMGVRPRIGIRVKLAAKGSGRWEASGGDRSKFGLSTREVVEAINFLRANDLLSCFELLHFHLGSQISAIRAVKNALREAGRFYVEVVQAGRAAQVLRRRRRPGRRLRRLADQLRLVDELHDAGVRQRHRVLAAGDLRRRRRAAPDHRHRVGARRGGAPLDAGDRHPGRRRVRRRQGARARSRKDASRMVQEPVRDLPRRLAQERARGRTTTRSSTRKRRCSSSTWATSRCPSGWSPRTSSGPSARRS